MRTNMMLAVLAITAVVGAEEAAQNWTVMAQDTSGVVVMVKEKYGSVVLDTCTVVMLMKDNFVLVHRSGPASWYPTSFHSVRVVRRMSDPVAASEIKKPVEDTPRGEGSAPAATVDRLSLAAID